MMQKIILFLTVALAPYTAKAGVFDSLKTVVGGHIDDLQSRFMDDQFIEGTEVARAQFRQDDRGQDTLHNGAGTVTIVETDDGRFLQLGSDFSSTPGPDYHVYISQDRHVDHEDRFDKSRQIELGRLVKGSGASYYKIPADTEFKSITIWCKAFGEFIVSADFE